MDQLEQDLYDLWAELQPEIAFRCGDLRCAGKFFIPSEANKECIRSQIGALKVDTLDSVNLGLLNLFEFKLRIEEPYKVLYDSIWAYFTYLTKEGINVHHITSLTRNIIIATNTIYENLKNKTWSTEMKMVTMTNYLSLLGVLNSIQKESPALKPVFDDFRKELNKYMKKFTIEGIKEGDFSEVFPILEANGGNIGRKEYYPDILKYFYTYLETPGEIETQALMWLNEGKLELQKITEKLAIIHKTKPTVEAVLSKISKHNNLKKSELISFIEKLREPLRKLIEEKIVRITPKYNTKVIETPNYLLNLISTAAMYPFDLHTDEPFNVFFVTTNSKRSPPTNLADLFQLIIHEEFGHCVHFSNSATKFDAKIGIPDLLYTSMALAISDGISFYREWESLGLLKDVITKPEGELTEAEREFMTVIRRVNDPKLFLYETQFIIHTWRVVRFLRAIGDVRINMHKQTIAEFVTWAHEYTGLSKKLVFDQIFLFQSQPGYAPSYSIVGDRIRELQTRAKNNGKNEIDFNTFASSLGFPPRNVFEQKLKEF
jgi:hypothetical protein